MEYVAELLTIANTSPQDVEKELGLIKQYLAEIPQKALNSGTRILSAVIFSIVGI